MNATTSAYAPASGETVPERPPSPTVERLLEHPFRYGIAVSAALAIALFIQQLLLDRIPFGPAGYPNQIWGAVLHAALVGYVPAATLAVLRSAQRELREVRRGMSMAEDLVVRVPPVGSPTPGWWLVLAAGFCFGILGPWLTEPAKSLVDLWDPRTFAPEVYWHRVLGLWITTWMGWFVFAVVRVSRRLSSAAGRLDELDPFDTAVAAPFARQGLSNALFAAGLFSLVSLFWFDHGVTPLLVLVAASTIALTVLALLLPVRSVHRRIEGARDAELRWCDAQLAIERGRLRTGDPAGVPGRMTDLLAFREQVEKIRTWPFDTPKLRRIALYLLIPVGSWVASALVQTVVERLMGA